MSLLVTSSNPLVEITAANKANVCTYSVTKEELDQPVRIPHSYQYSESVGSITPAVC